MTTKWTIETVQSAGVQTLHQYVAATRSSEKATLIREFAHVVVTAREYFLTAEGTPDWKGRTHPFKVWMRGLFETSGLSKDELERITARSRPLIKELVLARTNPDHLGGNGLIAAPSKNQQDKPVGFAALTARDLHDGAVLSLTAAHTVITKVSPVALEGLEGDTRTSAVAILAEIRAKLTELEEALTGPD